MILDFEIELEDLEKQPEWVGLNQRVKELAEEKQKITAWFEREPKEWMNRRLNAIEKDVQLFENILSFWAINYKKLAQLKNKFEFHAKDFNKNALYLQIIKDQQMIIESDQEIFEETSESILSILKDKPFAEGLNKLKNKVNEYYKTLKLKL